MKNEGNIDFRATTISRSSSGVEMSRRLEGVCNTPVQSHDIINMNGRIYDPIVGQFMQADNYIQSPEDFISYNRYSYCLYNPFKYTDPSGEDYASLIVDDEPKITFWVPTPLVLEPLVGGVVYDSSCDDPIVYPDYDSGFGSSVFWVTGSAGTTGRNVFGSPNRGSSGRYPTRKKQPTQIDKDREAQRNQSVSDPSTWYKNYGIPFTNFTGDKDPQYKNRDKDYTVWPTSLSDEFSREHDIFYANIGKWTKNYCTGWSFLNDERTITADARYTLQQFMVASSNRFPVNERITAGVAGYFIGVCAIPKTVGFYIYCAANNKNANKILKYYDKLGRKNHPAINATLRKR